MPIYYSKLWNTKYAARFYDRSEHFLCNIYFSIFKKEVPAFSGEARFFIATMGDWYVGEYFLYIRIRGVRIVLDRLVLEEVAFQTVTDSGL